MAAILMITTIASAKANTDKPIRFEQLPNISKEFIRKYFNEKDISYAKVDTDFFDKSYEVFFVNGSKVEFDKKGDWEEINCLHNGIPAEIIPVQIMKYIEKNHSNLSIVKIERDSRDYEIKFNNNLEIKFDLKFNVIEYDH